MKFVIVFYALIAAASCDVSHLPSDNYLPPNHHHAASAPAVSFSSIPSYHIEAESAPDVSYTGSASQTYQIEAASAPAASYAADESYHSEAASAPAIQYSASAASYEPTSYESAASEPAHTFSAADGYRYKTVKRRVIRRQRRDVSHLSSEYLPPVAASEPAVQYESAPSYSAAEYVAPAASYETVSYETAAAQPSHSFSSAEGYRYKTAKRRVIRRHRY